MSAEHPDVVTVFQSRVKKLHTTNSWRFLGLERNGRVPKASLWSRAKFGEDIIIANIDTGTLEKRNIDTDIYKYI